MSLKYVLVTSPNVKYRTYQVDRIFPYYEGTAQGYQIISITTKKLHTRIKKTTTQVSVNKILSSIKHEEEEWG